MNLLAIESSTACGSISLFLKDQPVEDVGWERAQRRSEEALSLLPGLFQRNQVSAADFDLFAVGRGPGNYSGMRVALSIANALALPDSKPVFAVSSGEALATQLAEEYPQQSIAVVGDARRSQLWCGLFLPGDGMVVQEGAWELTTLDNLPSKLPPACLLATSDWERLEPQLLDSPCKKLHWIEEPRYPQARQVAELALSRTKKGLASEALNPLYMHEAVS